MKGAISIPNWAGEKRQASPEVIGRTSNVPAARRIGHQFPVHFARKNFLTLRLTCCPAGAYHAARMKKGMGWSLYFLTACLFVLAAAKSEANSVEVDWTSAGFSTSQITINAGDEVDIVNLDDTFDLYVTGAPPESFSADIPPTDGVSVYYLPYVYHNPGTFSFSDEFGNSVTVTVNAIVPLSVAITAPTNNATFTAPATFTVTAVPTGGATPYYSVEFFVTNTLEDTAFDSPFTGTISNLAVGTYTIMALVTDNNDSIAFSSSITVNVAAPQTPTVQTNYILPVSCATVYSSGSVLTSIALTLGSSTQGGLEFAAFDASQCSSVLLELSPYGLPLFGPTVGVYGFDGASGTLMASNYNSGTLVGMWTLPAGLNYGQAATFDVTAFVKSVKGPYFGFMLQAVGDVFCSTSMNYGLPPELFALSLPKPPKLAATRTGNQVIISWPTNNASGLSLQATVTQGPGASWNAVSPAPVLIGSQWVVTNSITGGSRFFRLSNH
jgi:hypothetical protein